MMRLYLLLLLLFGTFLGINSQEIDGDFIPATFEGGRESFIKYIKSKCKYPIVAQEQNLQGRILVRYTVDTDGSVRDIKLLDLFEWESAQLVIEMLKSSPLWKPASLDGKKVMMSDTVEVFFVLKGMEEKLPLKPDDDDIVIVGNGVSGDRRHSRGQLR